MIPPTPSQSQAIDDSSVGKPRSSNLELYRIICMIMIVAHHYVMSVNAVFSESLESANSIFLSLFGAWGKTGINCFMMITGYFMCTSKITIKKFLKLMLQVYFYQIIIYLIFLIAGKETVSFQRIMVLLMPVWGFSKNFTSCFIAFWLTIPFLTALVQHLNKRQHELLLLLALTLYTLLYQIPKFNVEYNYITWFGIIFFIASYIRLHPCPLLEKEDYAGLVSSYPGSKGDLFYYILDESHEIIEKINKEGIDQGYTPFRVNAQPMASDACLEERIQRPVEEWLRAFYDSKFIVTDSFHACVFSIIFNKPFYVIANKKRGVSRIQSLLDAFGLSDRLVSIDNITGFHGNDFKWQIINEKKTRLKEQSLKFIKDNLA